MAKNYSITVATVWPNHATAWEKFQHFLSIGGPIGWIPWVPATIASAVVAVLCRIRPPAWPAVAAITAGLYFVGVATTTTSERILGIEDPRNVVIDELAGQLLAFLFVLPTTGDLALVGFVLFRLFDIAKPFPAGRAERLPGGWGIMTDDIIAGLYAAVALYLLRSFLV